MKPILFAVFVFAQCFVFAESIRPFHLSAVKITKGEFKHAEQLGMEYILAHDPDRLLAPFLIDAGLTPKAQRYTSWENTGLDGHTGGHYLTALSQMYIATGNQELLKRLNYMIDELERCQLKNGNGYVGGVPGGMKMWAEIKAGKIKAGAFSLNGKWVPWYNIHKTYAGLRDAYTIANIEKAKNMLIELTDWCIDLIADLSDTQIQDMLRSEHGGMNEVFADVAELTGNNKYLKLAKQFSHHVILDPLLNNEDKLNGLHANTQIPKVIGFQRVAEVGHEESWHKASVFFYETVINKRTISIGGNSVREHFHPDNDFSSMMESKEGPESCNTYNMMKLAKMFYFDEGDLKYIDYYESALYNHILSTQHPDHGGLVYFTSMRPQHYRVYSKAEEAFWCCVGTGMENHGKYGELIYAHSNDELYVNLFIPSELTWQEKGMKLIQQNNFPDIASTSFKVETDASQKMSINLRYPSWCKAGALSVAINGKSFKVSSQPGEYINIERKWKNNDEIVLKIPMHVQFEQLPDKSDFVSMKFGPIVLAAATGTDDLDGLIANDSRMGHVANGSLYPLESAPQLIVTKPDEIELLRSNTDKMEFSINTKVYPSSAEHLKLIPFYRLHDARYEVYFPFVSEEGLSQRLNDVKKKEAIVFALEKQTIDKVAPGEQQPESDHNFKSENSESGVHMDRHWRHARNGWFSYELKDSKKEAKTLRITYFGTDRGRSFDILINNQLISEVSLDGSKTASFYTVDYPVPVESVKSSNGILELKFKAKPNSVAGGIYGIRLLR